MPADWLLDLSLQKSCSTAVRTLPGLLLLLPTSFCKLTYFAKLRPNFYPAAHHTLSLTLLLPSFRKNICTTLQRNIFSEFTLLMNQMIRTSCCCCCCCCRWLWQYSLRCSRVCLVSELTAVTPDCPTSTDHAGSTTPATLLSSADTGHTSTDQQYFLTAALHQLLRNFNFTLWQHQQLFLHCCFQWIFYTWLLKISIFRYH